MESRFSVFFALTRFIQLLLPLCFLGIPFVVFFGSAKGYEHEPRLFPMLLISAIVFPFVYLMLKGFTLRKIKLTDNAIEVTDIVKRTREVYPYTRVDRVDLKKYKIEGVRSIRGIWGRGRDVHYHEMVIVHLVDGESVAFTADDYANHRELFNFIADRKLALTRNFT